MKQGTKLRIADFVHGADGLGNQNFHPPKGKPIEQSAADFIVEQANLYPGKITVVALGPLTNIALVRFSFIEHLFLLQVQSILLLNQPSIYTGYSTRSCIC